MKFSELVVVGLHNLLGLCHGKPIHELGEVLVPFDVVGWMIVYKVIDFALKMRVLMWT